MRLRSGLLLLILLLPLPASAGAVTPQWVEQYLRESGSELLHGSEDDHVLSLYYFGSAAGVTLMGLERVRGDDYTQYFTLMLFRGRQLLGYYRDVLSFPAAVSQDGHITFPRGIRTDTLADGSAFSIAGDVHFPLCQTSGASRRCVPFTPVIPVPVIPEASHSQSGG